MLSGRSIPRFETVSYGGGDSPPLYIYIRTIHLRQMTAVHTRITLAILFIAIFSISVWSQTPYEQALQERKQEATHDRGDKLRAWRISPTGQPLRVDMPDTLTRGTHSMVAPEHRSLGVAYAGNANMPWQSKIFFDRSPRQTDFVYLTGYQGMLFSPDNVAFYDTRTPFTFVHYRKNFSDDTLEEVLNGTLSLNLGKAINVGVSAEHTGALGYYEASRSRNVDYRLFGSYRSDRYDLWAYIANDYYRQAENAGLNNTDYILNPDNYSSGRVRITSLDVPVNLSGSILYNRIRSGNAFLSHRYKLGHSRTIQIKDTTAVRSVVPALGATSPLESSGVRDSVIFVPVGSIAHQVYYNKASRRMISRTQDERWLTMFGDVTANRVYTTDTSTGTTTLSGVLPNDTAQLVSLHNTLSLSLLEGFRPWVKAGLTAYVRAENYWVSNSDSLTLRYRNTDTFFSTFVGAELSRQSGTGLNFNFRGELGVLGRDLGALLLEGDIRTRFRVGGYDFGLRADARLMNSRPSYFATHHHGTWGWWDADFSFVRRAELGGRIDLDSWGTWAELRTASLQGQIYWTRQGRAQQHSGLLQMSMLRAGHAWRLGILGWEVEGAYQLSSDEGVMPIPALTLRGDLYLDFYIASVLRVQLGTEGYWHTDYYAPYYMPTVMQFVNQTEQRVGGKAPLLNAYANFRHKNTRFYARMFNVGEALMKSDRLSMHSYAYNPMHLEVGLVVDLKR